EEEALFRLLEVDPPPARAVDNRRVVILGGEGEEREREVASPAELAVAGGAGAAALVQEGGDVAQELRVDRGGSGGRSRGGALRGRVGGPRRRLRRRGLRFRRRRGAGWHSNCQEQDEQWRRSHPFP